MKYLASLIGLLFFATISLAEDKNGVSPSAISLPSGPGSIEGLGESFQPMLNTGSARYSIAIKVPEGVNKHTPKVSLTYNSGLGEGPLGIGWRYDKGGISRQTDEGTPRYIDVNNGIDDDQDGQVDEYDELDRFLSESGEELIELADGSFRSRVEGEFVRYQRSGDHWIANRKDGTQLEFGITAQGRITDSTGTKIYRWLLEKETDTNGNTIEYSYASFAGSDNQKYLKEIRYGAGTSPWNTYYFVYFNYEDRPNWRKDYRSGFLIKTGKRLSQIDVGIHGAAPSLAAIGDWNGDTDPDALIRRYDLTYGSGGTEGYLLKQVTQFGSDGVSYLPPISFTYTSFDAGPSISAAGQLIAGQNVPFNVMDSDQVELVDLNNDGLPDILKTDPFGNTQTIYLNLGTEGEGNNQVVKWDSGNEVTSEDSLALNFNLSENDVHLADMNGDGRADLVQTTPLNEVSFYPNLGNLGWGSKTLMNIQDSGPPAPFSSADIVTGDMDFDKRMDIIKSTDNGYTIWFNVSEGEYSREFQTTGAIYQGQVLKFSDSGVRRADLNGDRMTDVAKITPTLVVYAANQGHGLFSEAIELSIPDEILTTEQVQQAQLHDINGDGLGDLLIERAVFGELWYWLNQGTDTFESKRTITDMPSSFGTNAEVRWADINGNNTVDLIYADSEASERLMTLDIGVLEGLTSPPNLLQTIDNGLGVITQITFRSSSEYYQADLEAGTPWDSTIPFNVAVVGKMEISTGLDLDGVVGNDIYTTEYHYRNGFYDIAEKAFRGFIEAEEREIGDDSIPTQLTTTTYFTGGADGIDNDGDGEVDEISPDGHREEEPLKGEISKTEVRSEDESLIQVEEHQWKVTTLFSSIDGVESRFPYKEETIKSIYEGTNTPETVQQTFLYDEYGNITEEKDYGATSLIGDEVFTNKVYSVNTTDWILDRIQQETITNEAALKYAETRYYYDGSDYIGLPLGAIEKGNLTRKEGWVNGDTYVDIERQAFDSYGNVVGKQDGNGSLREISYDNQLHRFPTQEIIDVGEMNLVMTVQYHLGYEKVTQNVDFNGNIFNYAYDSFGRLVKETKPNGSDEFPSTIYTYTMVDPQNQKVYRYDANGSVTESTDSLLASSVKTQKREISGEAGTLDSVQYTDGLGRKLALVAEAENGFVVKEAVLFNARQATRYEISPFESPIIDYQVPDLTNPNIEIYYDATKREVLRKNPEATEGFTQNSKSYLPLQETITDENGHSKVLFQDGRERILTVHEMNQGEIYVTQYEYNPLDKLTKITDAQNNVKTIAYDGLARKISMNDPDAGQKTYEYDAANNLIKTTDAKGQVISYTYDKVNRMLTEDYQDANNFSPDVIYHYDLPSIEYADATHTKGQLAWVEDLSGGVFFSYDSRGNIVWKIKRIKQDEQTLDFKTEMTYDALDRKTSMIWPDGESISYSYNDQGLLESIPGFVEAIDYEANSNMVKMRYVNNTETTYTWDNRDRMDSIQVIQSSNNSEILQSLSYTYDGVSNIQTISDGRNLVLDPLQDANQTFEYDDLDRLIQASGNGYGIINYQYDKIGNMISKTTPANNMPGHVAEESINLGSLSYGGISGSSNREGRSFGDPAGPHAVTATESGLTYDYDDNGNMILHANGEVYTWDFKNRLVGIQKEGIDIQYTYDYENHRIIKEVQNDTTTSESLYISGDYNVHDGQAIRYIRANDKIIAQVEEDKPAPGVAPTQTFEFELGWNFISLEVEPADPSIEFLLSSLDGKFTKVLSYDTEQKKYLEYIPQGNENTLSELHAEKSYLIQIIEPSSLKISGAKFADTISLKQGWNLVKAPINRTMAIEFAFSSISGLYKSVWYYDVVSEEWLHMDTDPETPDFLNTLTTISPGKAYWIEMDSDAELSHSQIGLNGVTFYHADHLGSTNIMTDITGNPVAQIEYFPSGSIRYQNIDIAYATYKYTGKELDSESGLMYYHNRYYDATTGVFASVDPLYVELDQLSEERFEKFLKNPQLGNLYSYVLNNPLKYNDPTGLAGLLAVIGDILEGIVKTFEVVFGAIKCVFVYISVGDNKVAGFSCDF